MLKKENDTIAKNVVSSILEILEQQCLVIKKTSLGGYQRHTAKLNLQTGIVTFTHGDRGEAELFNFING